MSRFQEYATPLTNSESKPCAIGQILAQDESYSAQPTQCREKMCKWHHLIENFFQKLFDDSSTQVTCPVFWEIRNLRMSFLLMPSYSCTDKIDQKSLKSVE